MSLNRRDFLVTVGAAGAATALGAELTASPAAAQDHVLSIALAARAPSGLNPQQTGLTGGDNWAISQIFDCLVHADDGTFAITRRISGQGSPKASNPRRMPRRGPTSSGPG